jgi:hypothetical protein
MRIADRWLPWLAAAASVAPGAGLAFLLAATREDEQPASVPVVGRVANDAASPAASADAWVETAA